MSVEHVQALAKGVRLNQYEMMNILGSGGFGITYLARDTTLDTTVAIKEYMPGELATRLDDSTVTARSSTSQGDFDWGLRRFVDEARVLAKFRHPNIVRVNQIFEANHTAYLVMEYAKGETLDAMLRRAGPIGEQQTKDILFPILDGLKRVHELGFLHRDIKPGNIIIRDEEGGAVLIDFGAAREATGSKTRAITSIVTEGYAPLEQYDATGNQGPWTDIYALGGVAYRCLTGNKPPSATSRVRNDPLVPLAVAAPGRVSAQFATAIECALRLHESERPQTIAEFLALVSGTAVPRTAPPPADATQIMRPDATQVLQPDSFRNTSAPSGNTGAAASAQPAAVSVKPPAHTPVIKTQPAPRNRSAAYLGVAAAVLLIAAAGGWYYLQPKPPAGDAIRVADSAAPPAPAPTPAPAPAPAPSAPAPPPAVAPAAPAPQVATLTPPTPPQPSAASPSPAAPPAAAPAPAPGGQAATRAAPAPAPAAPPRPSPIPPPPATPAKVVAMLRGFNDAVFKATLAQPGLRGRVETLLGLEGCDWRVNANAAGQPTTRQAGSYLNGMNDKDLRDALNDGELLDRIDAAFGRGNCNYTPQTESTITKGFPEPKNSNQDPGYGYPGNPGRGQNPYNQGVPNVPGGYGGYGVPGYTR